MSPHSRLILLKMDWLALVPRLREEEKRGRSMWAREWLENTSLWSVRAADVRADKWSKQIDLNSTQLFKSAMESVPVVHSSHYAVLYIVMQILRFCAIVRQKIRNCNSRRQQGGIVKLSNLSHFVTVKPTAADGHESWVIVHCSQMLQVGRGRPVLFLFFGGMKYSSHRCLIGANYT